MKKVLLVLAIISMFLLPLMAQDYGGNKADFESDFQNATKMATVGSGASKEAARGTDLLIKDATTVLHRENMAILDEIAKLHKEIADLKRDIKAIKGQVE